MIFLTLVAGPLLHAQERPEYRDASGLIGAAGPAYQILNINNITTWLRVNGISSRSPSGREGTIFPRSTAPVVYQDGIMWVGKAFLDSSLSTPAPDQLIRAGGQTYYSGTGAGWIIGEGPTAVPVDQNAPGVRVYRIRRDYQEMSYYDLQRDAADFFEVTLEQVTSAQIQQVLTQYHLDWTEWPVDRGAPYIERNGVPGYQPPPPFSPSFTTLQLVTGNYDEPGVAGLDKAMPADQVIYTIANDLNPVLTIGLYGSYPLGLEAQITLWGYRRTDSPGTMYFKRVRLINKGGVDVGGGARGSYWIDSMFIGQWTDCDIGHFGDDLLGCDTAAHRAFAYNGTSNDLLFRQFNLPPPAVGWNLLQGPVVPGIASDSAIFDFRVLRGRKNLGMTSFSPKWTGTGFPDPSFGFYEGTLQWWRWIQGYLPHPSTTPWQLYPFPPGIPQSKYPLSGDPVAATGHIDGLGTAYSGSPGSRRFSMNSGPFRLAPRDTQEIILAVVGGLGASHLTSITAMRFFSRAAHQLQQTRFAAYRPPAPPKVRAIALDREIILEWGTDLAAVQETETGGNAGGYLFEGYTVYQLPSGTARLEEGTRIATFDLVNNVTSVVEEMFDPATGLIIPVIVQHGDDSGIRRHLRITHSQLGTSTRLFNGHEYVFAVTAYNHGTLPESHPRSLESPPSVVAARPGSPFGVKTASPFGDTLRVDHPTGRSDGAVYPIVIDPLAGTGDSYRVGFDTTGGTLTWNLVNTSRNRTVIAGQTNFSGNGDYPIVEGGIYLNVVSPPPGLKRGDPFDPGWEWWGTRFLTWANGDGLGLEGFNGAAGWESPHHLLQGGNRAVGVDQLVAVRILFVQTDSQGVFNPSDPNASFGYRYGRAFDRPPARPEFVPYIINPMGGFAFQDYSVSLPLAVYDMDQNPPRRVAVGFLESNVPAGLVNGRYWPPYLADTVNNTVETGPREWLFIFDAPYSAASPDPALQVDLLNSATAPVMYMATWTRRNPWPWPPSNSIQLYPNRSSTPADSYEFVFTAPDRSAALAKASARSVTVFPNPYLAGQSDGPFTPGRYVTFMNLPQRATVRIYNLAGHLVRTLSKDDPGLFLTWDLKNASGWLAGSGMYLCHVEMPDVGETRVLKLAIVQEHYIPPVR